MKRTPGRPRDADRTFLEAAILSTALDLFLECGFENTSMEEVARRACVSKQTLYARFSGKADLFAAVITQRFEQHVASPHSVQEVLSMAPREFLETMGKNILHNLHCEETRKLRRLVRSSYPHFPELAKAFWQNGPGRGTTLMKEYLVSQCEAGKLSIPEPDLAVEQFCGMILGLSDLRESLGLFLGQFTSPEEEQRVSGAVDVFLSFYGPPGKSKRS